MKIVGQSSKALALLLMLASGFAAYAANTEKPNIIVIMADDMGFSDLGCYGGEIQTPNIDQLAREGVRFTGFKNTSRCTPSRASLLTGRYAHSVGVGSMSQDWDLPGYRGQLSTDAPTMAEILKPHGYATGIVGKWHQTVTGKTDQKQLFPLDRGFAVPARPRLRLFSRNLVGRQGLLQPQVHDEESQASGRGRLSGGLLPHGGSISFRN
jgi:arylsulfatase